MAHLTDDELLHHVAAGNQNSSHLATCPSCQLRLSALKELFGALQVSPITPTITAHHILQKAGGVQFPERTRWWRAWAVPYLLALLALLGVPAPARPTAPVVIASRTLSMSSAHASIRLVWQPSAHKGQLTAWNLPHRPGQVLTVWFIRGTHHIPVAWIPLSHVGPKEIVAFSVPSAPTGYQAIGATLETAPYRMSPSHHRVFLIGL